MVSRETSPSLAGGAEGSQEKAPTMRSALLKRDSPDAQGHLQHRRRPRPQQVRFKDLVDGGASEEPPLNTPRASATPPERGANSVRRSWPLAQPCLLSPPAPHKVCLAAAVQTSPGLQRPVRSKSACALAQDLPPRASASLSAHSQHPASPLCQQCPQPHAALCARLPPPPGQGSCLSASRASQHRHRAPPGHCCTPSALWLCPSPLQPAVPSGEASSEQVSAAPTSPPLEWQPPSALPGGTPIPQGPPVPASPLWKSSPSPALQPHHVACASGKPAPPFTSQESLHTTQAQPGAGRPRGLLPPRPPCCSPPPEACLSPKQVETWRPVRDLLQLVPVGKGQPGPSRQEEEPPASQVPPGAPGDVRSRLQSLEGVLETSQQTIRVLLDVIQDLEKKEARRDGRESYRTGQDVANCGRCRDCACVIYSVEHDFRRQEGRFQHVLSTIEPEGTQSPPRVVLAATPSPQELPPVPQLPVRAGPKKARRRCFWFL